MAEGLPATFSLYSCNSQKIVIHKKNKSCISDITYVINVKLTYRVKRCFEEHSLKRNLKFKRKWWFRLWREYGLVMMQWVGSRIRVERETEFRAVAEMGLQKDSVLLVIWAMPWYLGQRLD